MRCYHLSNMYLSSIQHGIQSSHSQMELFVKYQKDSKQKEALYDWAENHKTMIVLNGGFLSTMREALAVIAVEDNPYPWSTFHESEEALGGILTNVAIVIPEKIYETAALIRKRLISPTLVIATNLDTDAAMQVMEQLQFYGSFSDFEVILCNLLNKFNLAS